VSYRRATLINRLYTSETAPPPRIPLVDAFTLEHRLPGTPPKFISPMYTNLFANTPRDVMMYEGSDFPVGTTEFPFRTEILRYVQEYGNGVRHLVHFCNEITAVQKRQHKWCLSIRNLRDPKQPKRREEFDAVAVATGMFRLRFLISGHYDIPFIPAVPGIEDFPQDKITHSKYFRHASTYEDKYVLVIGNGPSGADISNQLLPSARILRRSVRSPPGPLATSDPNIVDVPAIKQFTKHGVELVDGTLLTGLDKVIFCTGYLYSLPMFPIESGFITQDGLYVHRLYDHTFYAEDPTLVFLGLPKQVVPFPTFQNQAIAVAKVWAGKIDLPSTEIMRQDEQSRLEEKGFEMGKYHSLKYPEDVEWAEKWRRRIEEDKSPGWEKSMKPWRWTEERVATRNGAADMKRHFYQELKKRKWDGLQLSSA
jgi:cation diffusion facilitator CzcD-associated flavoprotein CzcO